MSRTPDTLESILRRRFRTYAASSGATPAAVEKVVNSCVMIAQAAVAEANERGIVLCLESTPTPAPIAGTART